ncbi:DUF4167 domain-containing protein [Porphyrobacter sp. AAP82]|uniref:DUF4167 domain-containing protein n=1 Tax=Porphyrobacter sp. AAP82 TaxID=1248917 RepID=UPI0009DA78FF|nr:DUF4167 domain-containing protein [Porphyrobacter sp. AAP82]
MNNNRNNRRRGRGNRNQGGGGAQLNRIDSRARGNAPQMLDKYKKLAQDAQHNGDRVQMEYYLQFADHYFRVIADNKARQDEQRGGNGGGGNRRHDERENPEDFEDDFDFGRRSDTPTRSPYDQPDTIGSLDVAEGEPGQEGESFLADDRGDDRETGRGERDGNRGEGNRGEGRGEGRDRGQRRQPRKERDGNRQDRPERSEKRADKPAERTERADKPARTRMPRKSADDGEQRGIDSSILPPSIRGDDTGGDSGTLETVE